MYVHGQRVRTENSANARVTIRECDLERMLVLNTDRHTYRANPIPVKPSAAPPGMFAATEKPVCRATPRRQVEETGEVQQLFGMEAQHIRFWIYGDTVPGSCPDGAMHPSFLEQQRDGWYIAVPPVPECPAPNENERLGLRNFFRQDQYTRADGSQSPMLLPAKLTVKVPEGQGLRTEYTLELTELSTDPLDGALFDAPPDYQRAPDNDCQGENPVVTGSLPDGTPIYRPGCGVTNPRVVSRVDPEYSDHARKKKISGTVLLSGVVDKDGSVRDIRVERSLEPTLDENAVTAMNAWKFEPATKDGQPVPVKISVEMSFRLYPGPKHR